MKAKLAYLTSPIPGVFVLNIQTDRFEGLMQFEISRAHLAIVLIDGLSLSLRETNIHRVPEASQGNAEIA